MSFNYSESDMHCSSLKPDISVGSSLDSRLDKIDDKFDDLKNDISMMNNRIDSLQSIITSVSSMNAKHSLMFDKFNLKFDNLESSGERRLDFLLNSINTMKTDITSLISQLLASMNQLTEEVRTLFTKCNQNTARINSIEQILRRNNLY